MGGGVEELPVSVDWGGYLITWMETITVNGSPL